MPNPDAPAEHRLATYGSLAPGRVNHKELSDLEGSWFRGTVRGTLAQEGWGAALGYPGLVLDSSGEEVEVHVFESADLPDHWARLDAFEGTGYRRVTASVQTPEGIFEASIYVLDT